MESATSLSHEGDATFDPEINPQLFAGVTIRRVVAYVIDILIISVLMTAAISVFWILGILSFGVLGPLLAAVLPFIPLAYHTIFIGGPWRSTVGMRLLGIETRRLDGGDVGYLQAGLLTVVFYLSTGATGGLILLVALFNERGRTFHDYLCATVSIRQQRQIVIAPRRR